MLLVAAWAQLAIAAVVTAQAAQQPINASRFLDRVELWQTVNGARPFIEKLPRTDPKELPPRRFAPLTSACKDWWAQTPEPIRPYHQGSKECPNKCSGKGTCNYDIGQCQCTAGFGGPDCSTPIRRPCSYRDRSIADPVDFLVGEANLTAEGWTASRCAGVCDEVRALCYCGYDSKFARVKAPAGSPWGTPPVKPGLVLGNCKPSTGPNGERLPWGGTPWQDLYGPEGWCNAPTDKVHCGCLLEGQHGRSCETPSELWCPNQCNLRGQCDYGFCKCDEGWYGTACDKLKQGATYTPVLESRRVKETGPWIDKLLATWREPAQSRMPIEPGRTRKRPLIYVYDLPPEFNMNLVQIKNNPEACNWRRFGPLNDSVLDIQNGYPVETYFHEALLTSSHRTLDPEEADFFYVPVYWSCYAWPILGWADGPWFSPAKYQWSRPYNGMWMYLKAKRWIEQNHPYWNRTQGADHIFLTTHDEGACYIAKEMYDKPIYLTHWGRTELNHVSGTANTGDNYSMPLPNHWGPDDPRHKESDWLDLINGHPCYTPGKDFLLPMVKHPESIKYSPLMGYPPLEKDILFFFRGDCGHQRLWWYSRGIRQTVFRLAHEDDWWGKYKILVTERTPQSYSELLARSKFCLVAPGDGWSGRAEDSILHGCIPVVIQDDIEMVYHGFLDWSEFGVRIAQKDMPRIPEILQAFTPEQVLAKQMAVAKIWHRFFYSTAPIHRHILPRIYRKAGARMDPGLWSDHVFAPLTRFPVRNDAFHTVMQWLYSRMPAVSERYKREQAAGARSAVHW